MYCHWPKYSIFSYPCHMLPIELLEPRCKSSSLQKGQSSDIYLIQNINVDGLMWFFSAG